MRQNYSQTVLLHLPLGSAVFWSCQAVSTSPLVAPLRAVMPAVASSSWLPSSCLVQCIILQLVQLHERLHQGPECVCMGRGVETLLSQEWLLFQPCQHYLSNPWLLCWQITAVQQLWYSPQIAAVSRGKSLLVNSAEGRDAFHSLSCSMSHLAIVLKDQKYVVSLCSHKNLTNRWKKNQRKLSNACMYECMCMCVYDYTITTWYVGRWSPGLCVFLALSGIV